MDKLTKGKLLVICVALMLINIVLAILFFNLDSSTYENLDGSEVQPHSFELIKGVLFGLVISIPILCFIVSLLVAVFIDRNLPYSQRIIRSFLLTLFVVYGIYSIMGLLKLISF